MLARGERERLPGKREAETYELVLVSSEGTLKMLVSFGRYEDGRLGEVFIGDCGRGNLTEGGFIRVSLDAWARTASKSLQHGTPPEQLGINGLRGMPGRVTCPAVPAVDGAQVLSPWDALARLIEAVA